MTKHVGLVGRIGPAFTEGRSRSGVIEVADVYNDQVWEMPIPGKYFGLPAGECLRAAFDHLIATEDN